MDTRVSRCFFLIAIAPVALVTAQAFGGCVSFMAPVNYAAGANPASVAVGDLDGDGKADLATTNPLIANGADGVAVLIGAGDGTFKPPVSYDAGNSPYAIVIGEINGDGKPDIVVSNLSADAVSVLLGNGDGTFGAPAHYGVGSRPGISGSLAIADFNGDGKADIVTANGDSGTVSILLGMTGGTFAAAINYPTVSDAIFVAAGDFNRDGKADLAVDSWVSDNVSILIGNGDGTFQSPLAYSTGSDSRSLAVSDFDGDGIVDLAFSSSFLPGWGNGAFKGPRGIVTPHSWWVVTADFNGDGKADLAVPGGIVLGNGDGTFASPIAIPSIGSEFAVGDLNGDGKPDLFGVTSTPENTGIVAVLINTSNCADACAMFGQSDTLNTASNPEGIAAGNITLEAGLDLAVVHNAGNTVSVWHGFGNGSFLMPLGYAVGTSPVAVVIGDFNGDGKADLAVANSGSDDVSILLGGGDLTFLAAVNYNVGVRPFSIAVGDLNGDDREDLAVANFLSGNISVLLGNGNGTFGSAVHYAAGSNPASVAIADLNRDGKADLAVACNGSDNVSVLRGNGNGTFETAVAYAAGSAPVSIAIGDFNRDGKPDLAVVNTASANVSVLAGAGDGTFSAAVNYGVGTAPRAVVIGDVSRDGIADLAIMNFGSNNVSILRGVVDGTFLPAVNFATGAGPFSAAIADLDRDGNLDLAITNHDSNTISILLDRCAPPDLRLTKAHTGDFIQGQSGTYTLTVKNVGLGPTNGTVFVRDFVPLGFHVAGMEGAGWSCGLVTCSRSDVLSPGSEFPPVFFKVNIASNADPSITNIASVWGGGDDSQYSTTDPTAITGVSDLTVVKTHAAPFVQGQSGTYTIVVFNQGGGPTTGTVTMTDTLPAGLVATGIAGPGWSCDLGTLTCTRSDPRAGGSNFPGITLTVDIAADAPPVLINTVSVSGGGETNVLNDTGADSTTITQVSDLSIVKTHSGYFYRGQSSATYTLVVHNAGPSASPGFLTVHDALPAGLGLTPITLSGVGWLCTLSSLTCTRNSPAPVGASYPPITLTVSVARNASAAVTNTATVTIGGDPNLSNNTTSDSLEIFSPPPHGDFDSDRRSDVIWRNRSTGQSAIWLMDGVTILSPAMLPLVPDPAWTIAGSGDFDGDRKADLIWVHAATGKVVIWLMDGASLRSASVVTTLETTAWKVGGVGDINNDGRSDVIWSNNSTGQTVAWMMDGVTISSCRWLITMPDLHWKIAAVGDFFGDGTADLLWRHDTTGDNLFWWFFQGGFDTHTTTSVADLSNKVVGSGDVDGDGRSDVVWWNEATGDVVVWFIDSGHDAIGKAITTVTDVHWNPMAVGDFDGDGKADIFWQNTASGETVVWLMDGQTIRQATHVTPVSDLNWMVIAPK